MIEIKQANSFLGHWNIGLHLLRQFSNTFLCLSTALAGGFYNWTLLGSKKVSSSNAIDPLVEANNTETNMKRNSSPKIAWQG